MKQFNFDTPKDFESFFSGRNLEVADAITEGIRVAVKAKKKNKGYGREERRFRKISL